MSDQTCDCCGPVSEHGQATATPDRWLGESAALDATLPEKLSEALGRLTGDEPVETLDSFVSVVQEEVGGVLAVEDLCHTTEETPHTARIGEERHQFLCFFDSVALAQITEEPVEFTTESPAGEAIEGRVEPDGELTTEPTDVVMSFGVAPNPEHADEALSTAVEAGICPYIRAFTSRERYEQWDERVAGPTVGMTLSAGVPFAAELADA